MKASRGYPKFDDLETSTRTSTVYSNLELDLKQIFYGLPITELPEDQIPRTKKRGHVDKKRLMAPRGAIISVQNRHEVRGLDTRTKKTKPQNVPVDWFLNQITVIISIGNRMLNIMLFHDCLKIVGCKAMDDCLDCVNLFFRTYIEDEKGWWRIKDKTKYPIFCVSSVMRNMDFHLGFDIDRCALNILMNSDEYENVVYMSQYETTGHTNVNIKMYGEGKEVYYILKMIPGKETIVEESETNRYGKKKKKKDRYVTFIVFSSSETIISGRSEEAMKEKYKVFIDAMTKHRKKIEDKPRV